MKPTLYTVCSTFSATSNANTNIQNGLLQIGNTASGQPTMPAIFRGDVKSISFANGLQEQPNVMTISWTAANSTEYVLRYISGDGNTTKTFSYTSDASATANEIGAALLAWINTTGFATTSYTTGSSMTITAVSGQPLFSVYGVSNLTVVTAMPTITPATLNPPTQRQIAGTTTVTVTTAAAQTFRTGDIVTISGFTGPTLTDANGNTYTSSITTRIVYASATTFTLDGITSDGTNNTTSITITKVASQAFGTKAQVEATLSGFTASSTDTYGLMTIETEQADYKVWLDAFLTASPFTATSNLSTFVTDMLGFRSPSAFAARTFGLPIS